MKASFLFRLAVLAVAAFNLAGCATYITVSAEPEGADIYARGSGRPSYGWKHRGKAPVTFKAYYNAIQTVARWPDGTVSTPKRTSLVTQQNVHVHHQQTD